MTPKKLEDQLKEVLLRREIRPSPDSWEKIANRLDAVQKPAKRRRAGWIYLAAASLLLLLGLRLLLPGADVPAADQVVANPSRPTEATPPGADRPAERLPLEVAGESAISTPGAARVAGSIQPSGKALAEVAPLAPEEKAAFAPDTTGLGVRIDAGLNSVLAAVAGMEGQKQPVTDQAVASLLRQAQEDIARDQYAADRTDVDAMALLSDAEEELEQTFREQILEKLKTGFNRVRTAVASRNE